MAHATDPWKGASRDQPTSKKHLGQVGGDSDSPGGVGNGTAAVFAGDPLAGLAMTAEGIVHRDAVVIDACVERGIPVAVTLGGGYSPGAWRAQYRSIARTIDRYGAAGGQRPHRRRSPTVSEKLYTK